MKWIVCLVVKDICVQGELVKTLKIEELEAHQLNIGILTYSSDMNIVKNVYFCAQ